MALLLRASGHVVINSMIDGFNASRMGCPERQNRMGNIYFPVAWNRVGLLLCSKGCLLHLSSSSYSFGSNFSTMDLRGDLEKGRFTEVCELDGQSAHLYI